MTPRIEEKIKEGKLRLARKLKLHQCSVVTTANALLIMEETIADVIEAQKQSDVEKLEGLKKNGELVVAGCPDNQMGCLVYHQELRETPEIRLHNKTLDEAIKKIQG